MIPLLSPKVILYSVGIAFIIGLIVYVSYLRNSLITLKANNQILNSAIETQNKTIDKLKEDYNNIIKAKDEINKKIEDQKEEKKEFKNVLDKVDNMTEDELNITLNSLINDINLITVRK